MNAKQATEFVEAHGVVLQSARGPIPNLADAIAGTAIKGSWWGHPIDPDGNLVEFGQAHGPRV